MAGNSHNTRKGSSVVINLYVLVALIHTWKPVKIVSFARSFTFTYFLLSYAEVACKGGRWLLQVSLALTSRKLSFFCNACLCVSYNCRNNDCLPVRLQHQSFQIVRGSAYKSLARPGRKQVTATKIRIYSTYSPRSSIHFLARCCNFCKPLKKNSEGCPSFQVSAAAVTSASDEKWRPFNCFFSPGNRW